MQYPYAKALAAAERLKLTLNPFCEKIAIVGSLRRRKPSVKDIELLFIPKLSPKQGSLFSEVAVTLEDSASAMLDYMVMHGMLRRRLNSAGHPSWGPLNKLAIDVETGIPVDFFGTTAENWWVSLVIRTGGKQSNINLATQARRRGWMLQAYSDGYHHLTNGSHHACTSEEDVFKFIGLQCPPPTHRA